MGTYVEGTDQRGQGKRVLAEHFQRLELAVVRAVFEFHSNYIIAGSILGQLESNGRGIVGYKK